MLRPPIARAGTNALMVAVCCLLAVGCQSQVSNIPTLRPANGGMTALLEGDLVVAEPCLYVEMRLGDHPRWLVVWPSGFFRAGDTIRGRHGEIAAVIGQFVSLGGGELVGTYDELRPILATDVLDVCRDSAFWLARTVSTVPVPPPSFSPDPTERS